MECINQDLTAFNTLGLPSRAAGLWCYESPEGLAQLAGLASHFERMFVLGGGSNVVLAPNLNCLVVKVQSKGIQLLDESSDGWVVEAQAGEVWHDFVETCVSNGWNGLENLALIPGTVGAAPVQNIGAYGVELEQRIHSVVAWDMASQRMVELGQGDCGFAYRDSRFKRAGQGRWLITAVRFSLHKHSRPVLSYPSLNDAFQEAQFFPQRQQPSSTASGQGAVQASTITPRQVFDAVCRIRRSKLPDPAVLGNAGSFFKNPIVSAAQYQALNQQWPNLVAYAQPDGSYKLAAGWLIEQAGWKGRRLGPVGMHERQALVLANYGGADAGMVTRLAERVMADVEARFGVRLEQEPVMVN